jgi:hypothetical protein
VRPVCGLSNLEILAELAAALGLTGLSYSPDDVRRDLAASLGLNAVDIEKARAEKARWPGKAVTVKTLIPLKTVTTVPKVDLLSCASMDGFVKGK